MKAGRRTVRGARRRKPAAKPRALPRTLDDQGEIGFLVHDLSVQQEDVLTQNRQLEQARLELENSISYYADLYDNAPIAFLTLDSEGLVTDANMTSVKLFGRERDHLVGKPFMRLVSASDRGLFLDHLRRCRQEGSAKTDLSLVGDAASFPAEVESRGSKRRGTRRQFHTTVIDLRDRKTAESEREAALRERRRAEERERAANTANEAKDRFIAELSHELRTPLTPVLAAVTGLLGSGDVPETLRPTIEMIRRNVEIESRLINDLLDVNRIARQQLRLECQNLDAHDVLREAARTLEAEIESAEIEFAIELNARDSRVSADPLRLRQIFWNLIANAVHCTPKGGQILVSSANIGRDVRFLVRDTGIGIEAGKLEKIFAPFSAEERRPTKSASRLGLGLGLTIVKGLVEAHRGRIIALSGGPGQGATFVVELPAAGDGAGAESSAPMERTADGASDPVDVAAPSEASSVPARRPDDKRKRVLVVEDDPDTGGVLKTFLELEGYEVRLATDAATAAELAREPLDILVCDIGLPDGSGLELMRRISAERPIKAIALTGYGSPRDLALSAKAGFAKHLTKPIAVEDLIAAIEALGESTGEAKTAFQDSRPETR